MIKKNIFSKNSDKESTYVILLQLWQTLEVLDSDMLCAVLTIERKCLVPFEYPSDNNSVIRPHKTTRTIPKMTLQCDQTFEIND